MTSTKASAKILKIDPSKALAMKGVVGFLDHTSIINSNKTGLHLEEEIFATEKVFSFFSVSMIFLSAVLFAVRKNRLK